METEGNGKKSSVSSASPLLETSNPGSGREVKLREYDLPG